MGKEQIEKISKKITKLCYETKMRILNLNKNINEELINFANEYNRIWQEA